MTLYSSFLLLPDLEACGYETTKEYNSFYFNFCDFLPQVVLGENCQFSVKNVDISKFVWEGDPWPRYVNFLKLRFPNFTFLT